MSTRNLIAAFGIGAALLLAIVPLQGRGQGGAPNRSASKPWPPQKLPDGQPDVQGIWAAVNAGSTSLTIRSAAAKISIDVSPVLISNGRVVSSTRPTDRFHISRGRPRARSNRNRITSVRPGLSTSTHSTGACSRGFRGCTRSFRHSGSSRFPGRSCSCGMNTTRIESFHSTGVHTLLRTSSYGWVMHAATGRATRSSSTRRM